MEDKPEVIYIIVVKNVSASVFNTSSGEYGWWWCILEKLTDKRNITSPFGHQWIFITTLFNSRLRHGLEVGQTLLLVVLGTFSFPNHPNQLSPKPPTWKTLLLLYVVPWDPSDRVPLIPWDLSYLQMSSFVPLRNHGNQRTMTTSNLTSYRLT